MTENRLVTGRAISLALRCALLCGAIAIPAQASAQVPPPPRNQFIDDNGIDMRSGNATYSVPLLRIGPADELGLDLTFSNSGGGGRDSFENSHTTLSLTSGYFSASASFGESGGGFGPLFSTPESFVEVGPSPRFQRKDGSIVSFGILVWEQYNAYEEGSTDTYRLADSVEFANGVRWTIHYKVHNSIYYRIQSVTSNTGYQIKFTYASNVGGTAAWSKRTSATGINMAVEYCNPTADTCTLQQQWPTATYTYPSSSEWHLTNAAGGITKFRSFGGNGTTSPTRTMTLPGGPEDGIKYYEGYMPLCGGYQQEWHQCNMGTPYRITKITTPERTSTYSYNYVAGHPLGNGSLTVITRTDPGGVQTVYESNGTQQLGMKSIKDALNRTTAYQFDVNGLLRKGTWPELNRTEWVYNQYGSPTSETAFPKSGSGSLSMSYTYEPCAIGLRTCGKVRTATDPRQNTTEYRYNSRGQMTAEIGPPNANGIRPLRRWFYEDRYAYIKNASGSIVPASSPVSVLVSEVVCRETFNGSMTNPDCASAADAVTTTYQYGAPGSANALLVRAKIEDQGGGRLNLTTCYGYDRFGNRIYEIRPNANLPSCS